MAGLIQHFNETGEVVVPGTPSIYTWPTIYPGTPDELSGTVVSALADRVVLPGSASVQNGAYRGFRAGIVSGTGAGQVRDVSRYTGNVQTAFVTPDWGTIPDNTSGIIVTLSRKFFVQNIGDEDLDGEVLELTRDGANSGNLNARIAADSATIIPPYNMAISLGSAGAGGVWSGTGLKYYRVTATTASGETNGSIEVSVNVDVTTKKITLTWTPPAGATAIKVYRSTTAGTYGASSLRASLSGVATGYVDDGTATGAGQLPSANGSGGGLPFYGTPPALGFGPLSPGTLAPGQMYPYWLGWDIPSGAGPVTFTSLIVPSTT